MVPWAGGWHTICGQHRGVYLLPKQIDYSIFSEMHKTVAAVEKRI